MTSNSREIQVVNSYIEKIDDLVEVDYGDFKRKLGQYIIRMEEVFAGKNPQAQKNLNLLRQKVLFNSKADIEETRETVLNELRKLSS